MGSETSFNSNESKMKEIILSILRYVSLPLALLYGLVIFLRNKFYDWNIFSSMKFSLPVISVGNLTVGGTGKSPHIEYLIEFLFSRYQVATLSRGYRRRSRGFRLAHSGTTALEIGDEPFQFKSKYPTVEVCVAEERMLAIPQLLQQRPYVKVILLDDAFQHRTVRPGLSILLTDVHRLYTKDYIMPFGLLRESRSAAQRADVIIVTKCEDHFTAAEAEKIKEEINPGKHQQVFFTCIQYLSLYPMHLEWMAQDAEEVLLVTGIANPKPLQTKLESQFKKIYSLQFADHHYFTSEDMEEIKQAFDHISNPKKLLVTTEKDASRFFLQQEYIRTHQLPIYVQRIGVKFLFDGEHDFHQRVNGFVEQYYPVIEMDPEELPITDPTLD